MGVIIVPHRSVFPLVLLLGVALGCPLIAGDRTITFDQILGGEVWFGTSLERARFDASGRALQVGEGEWMSVESGEATDSAKSESSPPAVLEGLSETVIAALPSGASTDEWLQGERLITADGTATLISRRGGLVFRRAGQAAVWISLEGERELVSIAPDGRHASWVVGNDLFAIDLPSGDPIGITSAGTDELLHGKLDWVYQEEVYGRGNFNGHWWSPDGQHLAFLRLDESNVPAFRIVDHVPARQQVTTMRYPKAGDPNPGVSVGVYSVARDAVTWVDLAAYGDPAAIIVVRVGWTPDGGRLILQVQDRIQTWLDLLSVDPTSGQAARILNESSETWVNVLEEPRWLAGGGFLWLSERTGFRHLYRYPDPSSVDYGDHPIENQTQFIGPPITVGDWQVDRILRVDEDRREIWFSASIPSAVESHAYRVSFDGGVLTQLTLDPGSHGLTIAPDGEHYLDQFASHRDPGELRLCDRDGRILRIVAEGSATGVAEYAYSRPERLQVPARDGHLLDAMLFRPVPFDEGRSYPVWLMTYSGPDAPTVRDSWQGDAWKQFLCQQGIIVFQVNNRSSSGRGQKDTETAYRMLGIPELRDLEDAVGWLTAHPWADAGRVGITGWSYGGFMTAFALTHSKLFSLGIAGAGVYDWHLYDTIYTERYMQTPELNSEGYAETSVIGGAAGLHGHLLIVHGMDDDNVHVQNAMQLSRALQRAGKQFELMVYPTATHGIGDPEQRRHLRVLEWKTIGERLLGESAADGLSSGTEPTRRGSR